MFFLFLRSSPAGMAELASLVQRLEVAVGRLEAIGGQGGAASGAAAAGNDQVCTV